MSNLDRRGPFLTTLMSGLASKSLLTALSLLSPLSPHQFRSPNNFCSQSTACRIHRTTKVLSTMTIPNGPSNTGLVPPTAANPFPFTTSSPTPTPRQHSNTNDLFTAGRQDPTSMPRDAKLVSLILHSMGVEEHEPRVIPQLLEFVHRKLFSRSLGKKLWGLKHTNPGYVLDILGDAQLFADHANHKEIDLDDVRLAVEGRVEHSFTSPPSRDVCPLVVPIKPHHCCIIVAHNLPKNSS